MRGESLHPGPRTKKDSTSSQVRLSEPRLITEAGPMATVSWSVGFKLWARLRKGLALWTAALLAALCYGASSNGPKASRIGWCTCRFR